MKGDGGIHVHAEQNPATFKQARLLRISLASRSPLFLLLGELPQNNTGIAKVGPQSL
jgi:hypothetical protein